MSKGNRTGIILGMLIGIQVALVAQNSTNSPYTRYGYGMLADRSFGAGRSMGGTGYGLRSSRQINPMNPASYSCMDSLTFLFDAGASMHFSWYNDGTNRQKNINGNLEYFALQFPLWKNRIAMSAGMLPYSHVGYDFWTVSESDGTYPEHFSGTGGLNEVYIGLAWELWKKRLSVGANISYMFGNIDHRSTMPLSGINTTANDVYTMKQVNVHNLKYDFGLQYTHPVSKTERITLGVAYSPHMRLKTTSYDKVAFDQTFTQIFTADTTWNRGFDLPHSLGVGLSYVKDNKLMLAADVTYQSWSQAKFSNRTNEFDDRIKVAAGGEYIPNNFTRLYLNRVRYRAGVHYSNSYEKFKGSGYTEYGACVGAGFPMLDNRSFINTSFEYVRIVPGTKALISEQYFRITISYTFNERWFAKLKLE
ncbi:MAG: outer membrane protein transport protein [Tannerella sp.]|jgi:hypothetical protein|nr:outer membrane protein transport protein [Tannerella sp.]